MATKRVQVNLEGKQVLYVLWHQEHSKVTFDIGTPKAKGSGYDVDVAKDFYLNEGTPESRGQELENFLKKNGAWDKIDALRAEFPKLGIPKPQSITL